MTLIFFFKLNLWSMKLIASFIFSYMSSLSDLLYWRNLITQVSLSYSIGMCIFCQYTVIILLIRFFFIISKTLIFLWSVGLCSWIWHGSDELGTTVLYLWAWRKYSGAKKNGLLTQMICVLWLFIIFEHFYTGQRTNQTITLA